MTGDFDHHRANEFAWSSPNVYLNAASFGPLPGRSRAAIDAFNTRRWRAELTDDDIVPALHASRAAAARLINGDVGGIALTPNTSFGINIAATAAFHRDDGRRTILMSDREFPANVYPWLALARQGFDVEILPVDEGGLPREDVMLERIEAGDVAAVTVSLVQYASGYRADVEALGAACQRTGTLFVVDAIQGIGALPFDAVACHADIVACGAQKWLCAPWGSGFTWVRPGLVTSFEPLLPGWLAFTSMQDFANLTNYQYDLVADARRFEVGSHAFQDYVGFQHSLELLLELDVAAIWRHIRALQQPIVDWAHARGVPVASPLAESRRSGILCLQPPGAAALQQTLRAAGVACAFREGAIRLAPHWYNTGAEIEHVLAVLDQHLKT